jgi:hypothetical protein
VGWLEARKGKKKNAGWMLTGLKETGLRLADVGRNNGAPALG